MGDFRAVTALFNPLGFRSRTGNCRIFRERLEASLVTIELDCGRGCALLKPAGFDPVTVLAPGPEGAWRWASDKPQLHEGLDRHFRERREDGD